MDEDNNLQIVLTPYNESTFNAECDLGRIIYDLDSQVRQSTCSADKEN